jgi:integrase
MRRLLEAFGGNAARTVTAEDIEQFKAGLSVKVAPATVNRHLALLRSVYYLGIRNRKVEHNPMRGVKLFRENNARVRYMTEEEEFRLLQTLPERYRPLMEIGLLTGLRASNLIGLRWRDVDLEAGVYTIPESKSGETLRFPMHPQVKAILAGLPRNGVYVFAEGDGEPPWDFTHTFAASVKRAGIHDLHLHDLRHTFASRLAMAGVDLLTIKELGGWKTLSMVTRYAHLSPDHKRAALGRLISYRTDTATSTRQETTIGEIQGENGNYLKVLVPGAGVEPA